MGCGMEGRKNFAPNSPKKKPHFYYCGKWTLIGDVNEWDGFVYEAVEKHRPIAIYRSIAITDDELSHSWKNNMGKSSFSTKTFLFFHQQLGGTKTRPISTLANIFPGLHLPPSYLQMQSGPNEQCQLPFPNLLLSFLTLWENIKIIWLMEGKKGKYYFNLIEQNKLKIK